MRQAFQRRLQHRALLQGAAIGERQLAQLRVVLEQQALELRQPLVLRGHHGRVGEGVAGLVVDREVLVELEQVHQLPVQLPCDCHSTRLMSVAPNCDRQTSSS